MNAADRGSFCCPGSADHADPFQIFQVPFRALISVCSAFPVHVLFDDSGPEETGLIIFHLPSGSGRRGTIREGRLVETVAVMAADRSKAVLILGRSREELSEWCDEMILI